MCLEMIKSNKISYKNYSSNISYYVNTRVRICDHKYYIKKRRLAKAKICKIVWQWETISKQQINSIL